jgi:hypothetical protein
MHFNRENFLNISDYSFVHHNFINDSMCDKISKEMLRFSENPKNINLVNEIKVLKNMDNKKIKKQISNILDSNLYCSMFDFVNTPKGISWGEHTDLDDPYAQIDEEKLYNGIVYFNDFIGGDIYYPEYNAFHHPKKGDLVIHESRLVHGVTETKSDARLSMSFVILRKK